MTAKFKQIIDQLNALITFNADKSMSDEDFIANIDAINLLCNLYDDLGLDRSGIRRRMNNLYSEFTRRIYGKKDIQLAVPLIKAFYRYIYDRSDDRGPEKWRDSFVEMCFKVVDSYSKCPLIDATEYLFALDTVCRENEHSDNNDIDEYKENIAALLDDIDNVTLAEMIRRVRAYERSKHLFVSDNWEKWAEVRESLRDADLSQLDDATFNLWREITDIAPIKELKRRAKHSKQMQVEYLQGLIFTEFARQRRLKAKRKLAKDLKNLNDEIIGDIISVKISSEMKVSTLYALHSIFYLRLQLAQVGWEENEPVYESLCRNRFEQIANALKKKYEAAKSLNERISILNMIENISLTLNNGDDPLVIEESQKLSESSQLTFSQKYRLDNLFELNSNNVEEDIDRLLAEARTAFDIAILFYIDSLGSESQRNSVMDLYKVMFEKAISEGNFTELANLIAIAADCNIDPNRRAIIAELCSQVDNIPTLSLPERRVNAIAAEIYSRIDKITGKYDDVSDIPA